MIRLMKINLQISEKMLQRYFDNDNDNGILICLLGIVECPGCLWVPWSNMTDNMEIVHIPAEGSESSLLSCSIKDIQDRDT